MSARKTGWAIFIVACLVAVGGHALAHHALGECTRDTVDELTRDQVTGLTMDGAPIPADKFPVSAKVALPFVVDVYYDVPLGIRTIRRGNRYFVLPGYTIKRPLPMLRSLPLSAQGGQL
ncbi:hypothetical protein ISN76_11095 [Dyella halodurans]|uniref:Uncharacterized protein n=1 Tax=Dyella halodurans TaxID=1920171 RepID=A0ABV9C2Z0_9GAMM|nr:hypothetical protein [Dyella halodurans]